MIVESVLADLKVRIFSTNAVVVEGVVAVTSSDCPTTCCSSGERNRSPRVRLLRCRDRLLVLVLPSIGSGCLCGWALAVSTDSSSKEATTEGLFVVVVGGRVVMGGRVVVGGRVAGERVEVVDGDEVRTGVKERPDVSVDESVRT